MDSVLNDDGGPFGVDIALWDEIPEPESEAAPVVNLTVVPFDTYVWPHYILLN